MPYLKTINTGSRHAPEVPKAERYGFDSVSVWAKCLSWSVSGLATGPATPPVFNRLQPWTAYCRNTCVCLLNGVVLSQCQDMARPLVNIASVYWHLQIHIGVCRYTSCVVHDNALLLRQLPQAVALLAHNRKTRVQMSVQTRLGKGEKVKVHPLYRHWGPVQAVRPIGGVEVWYMIWYVIWWYDIWYIIRYDTIRRYDMCYDKIYDIRYDIYMIYMMIRYMIYDMILYDTIRRYDICIMIYMIYNTIRYIYDIWYMWYDDTIWYMILYNTIRSYDMICVMIWYMILHDTIRRYDMCYDMIYDILYDTTYIYDMIWYDMIWYIWYVIWWYNMIRYMIWYYTIRYEDMIWYVLWYDIWYDILYDMLRCDRMLWYDVWWYMIWYYTIRYDTKIWYVLWYDIWYIIRYDIYIYMMWYIC